MTTKFKTPEHALSYATKMAYDWHSDDHLKETLRHSLYCGVTLTTCDVGAGASAKERLVMRRLHDFAWRLVGERVGSLAARHIVPPDCYAGVLQRSAQKANIQVQQLLIDAQNVYWLDRRRFGSARAKELWDDCWPLANKPVRLIYAFFERDGPGSLAGRKLLRGCVQTLADNKPTEELHHHCKMDAKHNGCKKQSAEHLQHLVLTSNVVETHGLRHAAKITKEVFRSNWANKHRFTYARRNHRAQRHKLPKEWSRIMGKKFWRSTSEIEGRIGASAWHWLQMVGPHHLHEGPHQHCGTDIGIALFSRLLLPQVVFMFGERFWATLGRNKWGALAWPLVGETRDDTFQLKFDISSANAGAHWHHVVDPNSYQVIPCIEEKRGDCIVLQKSGEPESLPKSALRKPGSLTMDDLERLAIHLEVIGAVGPSRKRLLELLANHLGGDDPLYIELVFYM
jgi:hypothetical protein